MIANGSKMKTKKSNRPRTFAFPLPSHFESLPTHFFKKIAPNSHFLENFICPLQKKWMGREGERKL